MLTARAALYMKINLEKKATCTAIFSVNEPDCKAGKAELLNEFAVLTVERMLCGS